MSLVPGDVILLYTDGTTEARDPQGAFFGGGRPCARRSCASRPPTSPSRASWAGFWPTLEGFTGQNLEDDVAMLALRFDGARRRGVTRPPRARALAVGALGRALAGNNPVMGVPVDIAIFNVEGDLDVRSVPAARRRLDALVAEGTRRIFMNMGDVSYVDSAGMGFILGELRRIRRLGGLLSLSNVSPQLYRALSLMRIVEYMPVSRAGARREGLGARPLGPAAVAHDLPRGRR